MVGVVWGELLGEQESPSKLCVRMCVHRPQAVYSSIWSGAVASGMYVQVTVIVETGVQGTATGQTGGLSPAAGCIHLAPVSMYSH